MSVLLSGKLQNLYLYLIRWNILPVEHREGIKQFVAKLVIDYCQIDHNPSSNEAFVLRKLNSTLVEIIKREWPQRWNEIVPDLCRSAQTSQLLCENNLKILTILAEDIFEHGKTNLTSDRQQELTSCLSRDCHHVIGVCEFVFQSHLNTPGSVRVALIQAALRALSIYIQAAPYDYIFSSRVGPILLENFFDASEFKTDVILCIMSILQLKDTPNKTIQPFLIPLMELFALTAAKFSVLPPKIWRIDQLYGNEQHIYEGLLVKICLLLSVFFQTHLFAAQASGQSAAVTLGLDILVKCLETPSDEVFKPALEFWHAITCLICTSVDEAKRNSKLNQRTEINSPLDLGFSSAPANPPPISPAEELATFMEPFLSRIRRIMVARMAKPPEVLIVVDEETGEVTTQLQVDTEETAIHKSMQETFGLLTILNSTDSITIINDKLRAEMQNARIPNWNPISLNRVCWAVGALGGIFPDAQERTFVIQVLRDLLNLCEVKSGKGNRASVASNIMHVVAQFPRFLRHFHGFLRVVIDKLLEFCHEDFPGVQQMAVNTIQCIAQKCGKKLLAAPEADQLSIFDTQTRRTGNGIVQSSFEKHCAVLDSQLQLQFYDAFALMITSAPLHDQQRLTTQLTVGLKEVWDSILADVSISRDCLFDKSFAQKVTQTVQAFGKIAAQVGPAFVTILDEMFNPLLVVYQEYSKFLTAAEGVPTVSYDVKKDCRLAKRASVRLVEGFIVKTAEPLKNDATTATAMTSSGVEERNRLEVINKICTEVIPVLIDALLMDYQSSPANVRDAEVIQLLAACVSGFGMKISNCIPVIFEKACGPTLDMLNKDFLAYPDHRDAFYRLLRALSRETFAAVMSLPLPTIDTYIKSLVWAIRHHHASIAELGLRGLDEFIARLNNPQTEGMTAEILNGFYAQFYLDLMSCVLTVLTDGAHASGFRLQSSIFLKLLTLSRSGLIDSCAPFAQVGEWLAKNLCEAFSTVTPQRVYAFLERLVNTMENAGEFANVLKDMLIEMKEYTVDVAQSMG